MPGSRLQAKARLAEGRAAALARDAARISEAERDKADALERQRLQREREAARASERAAAAAKEAAAVQAEAARREVEIERLRKVCCCIYCF